MTKYTPEYLRKLAKQPPGNVAGHREGLVDAAAEIERLRVALENIMGWIEGSEGDEQVPPRYLTDAREALSLHQRQRGAK